MAFYETVFIIRQDISSVNVEKLSEEFARIIKENAGEVIKTEYWGLRSLAYEINNNRKGHYVMFVLSADPLAVHEMERKMKLSGDVLRFMSMRVDQPSQEPSAILRDRIFEEESVDVTAKPKS